MITRIKKALKMLKIIEECIPEFKDGRGLKCDDPEFCGQGQMCKPCITENAVRHLLTNYWEIR
jgi:hypothetical protein